MVKKLKYLNAKSVILLTEFYFCHSFNYYCVLVEMKLSFTLWGGMRCLCYYFLIVKPYFIVRSYVFTLPFNYLFFFFNFMLCVCDCFLKAVLFTCYLDRDLVRE